MRSTNPDEGCAFHCFLSIRVKPSNAKGEIFVQRHLQPRAGESLTRLMGVAQGVVTKTNADGNVDADADPAKAVRTHGKAEHVVERTSDDDEHHYDYRHLLTERDWGF